jgi:hypothetical protein
MNVQRGWFKTIERNFGDTISFLCQNKDQLCPRHP